MQNRGGKYKFEGFHPLKRFGQFFEAEDVDASEDAEIPNTVVKEEHDVQVVGSDEDIYNLEALLEHVKRSVGNSPPKSSFIDQETPLDTTPDLIPRKRRRRGPWPGIVMRELDTEITSITQVPTIIVEPTEPVPRATESTAGPSFHTEAVDYDSFLAGEIGTRAYEGKNLQNKLFELEQDSLSHTLLTQELKTDDEVKYRKIKDLETNMGHLSAISLYMKQKLQEKFKGEFLDESCSSTAIEPESEMSRVEFDKLNRS
ncbi:hypothetical protein R6Q57_022821 [Mikania cordata]